MRKIGIIGSGNIGGTLTRLFTKAGHNVAVANSRGPSSLADLANETGAHPVTVSQAVQGSEIVVVTIPMTAVASLPKDLFRNAPADLIVIDTSNYYPQQRDGLIAEVEAGMTESAWVEQQIGRPVIKVFNSILAEHLLNKGTADKRAERVALAVAGDNTQAKASVMQLVEEIGFAAVDAGTIAQSWRQQPGSPGYLKDYNAAGVSKALSDATQERTPAWRATPDSPGTFESPA
ncbi:NADPH-dependent F420 reductase [Undibacterium sp. Ji42W]|uniref:NADPH-dependent F420 reductase n=1 Tax=Undibacterium sp. Ji42W TaxID=3413039 RepID=UPI003BF3D5FC